MKPVIKEEISVTEGPLHNFASLILQDQHQELKFLANKTEILRLDHTGMTYKGQRIEDAGEAHRAFIEVMTAMRHNPA